MVLSIISVIASLIIAVTTVVFNYLSNKNSKDFEERKVKIEYIYKTKLEIYEKLMEDFGILFNAHTYASEQRFLASLNKSLLVSNHAVQVILLHTIDLFQLKNYQEGIEYFKNNLSEIATDMQDSKSIVAMTSAKSKNNSK